MCRFFFLFGFSSFLYPFPFFFFQVAYRTASDKFLGKLSELFLVLSDSYRVPPENDNFGSQPTGRGTKHRLDDDQMSVESVKRPDVNTSAEKNKSKQASKASKSKFKNKSRY